MKIAIKNIIVLGLFLLNKNGFSQQSNKISFETGSVYNKALVNKEVLDNSESGSTFRYHWENTYYSSTGFYVKFEYEEKLYEKNKWSIYFPMGISYINQTDKYYTKGGQWGCFGGYASDGMVSVRKQHINFYAGVAVQYQDLKWRLAGNLLFNNCLRTSSKTSSTGYSPYSNYSNYHEQFDFKIYNSSQFAALFNVKNNIWVGPSCELFFYNFLNGVYRIAAEINDYGPRENLSVSFNMTGKNVWINPGIRVQIDLK